MAEKYIGIENEFVTFNKGKKESCSNDNFSKLRRKFDNCYDISNTSMRTDTGHGFYVDGGELEILTPPVPVNKGFATRLTDLLMIGRNKVVDATPDLEHTGYSIHWNLTYDSHGSPSHTEFLRGIAVPFHLFGLTPLSVGLNLRSKTGRYELLGDSLNNEEQIKATSLLLGAYSQAIESERVVPIKPDTNLYSGTNLFLPNGRYQHINLHGSLSGKHKIQAQQFLEAFYYWLKPCVKELGTKEEISNLEDFIFKRKELEFDKFKYFAYMRGMDKKEEGTYLPLRTKDSNNPGTILTKSYERNLPLEGRLLGEIVKQKSGLIESMDWNKICISESDGRKEIKGIKNIYEYASSLNNNLKFNEPQSIIPRTNNVNDFELKPEIKYDAKKDSFEIFKKKGSGIWRFIKGFGSSVKYELKDFYDDVGLKGVAIDLLVGGVCCAISFGIGSCMENRKMNKQATAIVQEYVANQENQETNAVNKIINGLEEEVKNGQEHN